MTKTKSKTTTTKSVTVRVRMENYDKMLTLTPNLFTNISEIFNFSAYVIPAWFNGNLLEKSTINNMLIQLRKEKLLD